MAYLVTITLLVDEPDVNMIHDSLSDMLVQAQSAVDPDNPEEPSWIVDYLIGKPTAVPESTNDAICNETYEEGDMSSLIHN